MKRHDASARTGARVALLAFLAVGLATAWLVPLPRIHTSPGGVVMPDLIAGFVRSRPSAETSPPGPTLLTFQSGALAVSDASESQQVLMGADGITFRKLDGVDVHTRGVFLAPNGRAVLLTEQNEVTTSIVHVDLVTGARHEFPLPAPQYVVIHAWSPDGRYVAFGESDSNEIRAESAQADVVASGTFVLLDLVTGAQKPLPQVGPIAAAAFSPDSTRLAVQSADSRRLDCPQVCKPYRFKAFVIDLHGTVLNDLTAPAGDLGIVPHAAWSPDGRWIAMNRWVGFDHGPGEVGPPYEQIAAVDATGGSAVRGPFTVYDKVVLGWRDPDHLLVAVLGNQASTTGLIEETSLADGTSAQVAAFDTPGSCINFILGDNCLTLAPMAATNLLPQVHILPAATLSHDNTTLRWAITGAVVLVGALWPWLSLRRRGGAKARQAVPR